jgi:UrcA family protein
MKAITLITAALVLSGSILSVAKASPPSDVPTVVVKFGDLDTTRPGGKEALYRRLTQAARTVCGGLDPTESAATLMVTPAYRACIGQAISGAVAKINLPEFTDYVAMRTQKPIGTDVRMATR